MNISGVEILVLIVSGILVGFINTLAGGGSVISLSLLLLLGLPANVANGTNRIAVLMQNIAAVSSFKQQKVLDWRKGIKLAVPAILGAIAGAWIAVDLNEEIIEKSIAVLMIMMLFFILFKPQRFIKERIDLINKKITWVQVVIFFFIGMYGGFIQMGVGYFLLAGLVLSAGYELVRANAVKVLIVLVFTIFALTVFIINDQVNYAYGFILGIGTVIGGLIGSRIAVKKGASFVRWVIIAVILFTCAHIFGLINIQETLSTIIHNQ